MSAEVRRSRSAVANCHTHPNQIRKLSDERRERHREEEERGERRGARERNLKTRLVRQPTPADARRGVGNRADRKGGREEIVVADERLAERLVKIIEEITSKSLVALGAPPRATLAII